MLNDNIQKDMQKNDQKLMCLRLERGQSNQIAKEMMMECWQAVKKKIAWKSYQENLLRTNFTKRKDILLDTDTPSILDSQGYGQRVDQISQEWTAEQSGLASKR